MKIEVAGIGHGVYWYEDNYVLLDNDCIHMTELVERAGGESVDMVDSGHFTGHGTQYSGDVNPATNYPSKHAAYRKEHGIKFPPVYRIKITCEVEELTNDEIQTYWCSKGFDP